MDLATINEQSLLAFKPTKSLKELGTERKYPVCKIKKVPTKYGDGLVAELEDCQVFLPKRLLVQLEDHLDDFKDKRYGLISLGEKTIETEKKTILLEFVNNI
ncbi:uncharacterized protein LOC108907054 [Anoplophora glabripennis]|uniref:uncharacterized protein LOC108907054 n=1 Tax=Anoplophora glabripennis TaxID=217634 RepID=UPI000874AD4E|nr:uncharacterized protein LOC108907054 [Anoplophora glabripennis]